MLLDGDHIAKWEFRDSLPGDDAIRAARDSDALGSGASAPGAINFEGHRRQIQDLIDSIHEHRPVAIDGHEARKALALIRGLYASAATGAPQPL